jgi:hypothetical protein
MYTEFRIRISIYTGTYGLLLSLSTYGSTARKVLSLAIFLYKPFPNDKLTLFYRYELMTLRQPFEGQDTVKELILEGGRPPLTQRELAYPSYFIDLMVSCWAGGSRERPSASQIVSITSAPEFTHLMDTILLDQKSCFAACAATTLKLGSTQGHQVHRNSLIICRVP